MKLESTPLNYSIVERLRSTGRLDRVFIDGEWVLPQGQARATVIDPSTEEPVAEIALATAQDVAAAVAAAEHIRVARDNLASYPFLTHRGQEQPA